MNIQYKKLYKQPTAYIVAFGVALAAFALIAGLFFIRLPSASALSGQGTAAQPFLIANCTDLQALNDESSTNGKYYELTGPIDCSATAGWNSGLGFEPIGDFAGVLDGNGYTISNITINWGDSSNVGIFGYISGGMVINTIVDNASVTGYGAVGTIAGGTEQATLINVHVTNSTVSSIDGYTGGMIGEMSEGAKIQRVTFTGSVDTTEAHNYTGGLIGSSDNSMTLSDVRVDADVTSAGTYTGGLIGRARAGYMTAIQNGKRIHVPNPEVAPIIKKAFELYLQASESTVTIWSFLAQAGVTTYNGRPIAKSAVHKLLQNPYYMGIIQFNGETYPGAHEPIISKNLYQSVQEKMHSKRPSKQRRHDIALRNIIFCGHCGKVITWQLQRGRLYGACQRDLPECRAHKFLREADVHQVLTQKMNDLISPSPEILDWLVDQLNDDFKENEDSSEQYQLNIKDRIARLERMDEMLYDDKLAGDISKERYITKHADITKQLEDARDDLLIADTAVEKRHTDAVDLIELTQNALEQYLDEELTNDSKRAVLTKLFDKIVYEGDSLSVKYRPLVQSIANKSSQSKEILKEAEMLNQTTKKDLNNGGHSVEKSTQELLFPIWQGYVESNHDPRFWRPIY